MNLPKLNTLLTLDEINPLSTYAAFTARFTRSGALASFLGVVRPDHRGHSVDYLYLDWYPGMSERSIDAVATDAALRFDIEGLEIVHRCGRVPAGAAVVFVGVASAHRRAAFEALDFVMDRLKSDIALWKREVGPEIDRWVEPTPDDGRDLERWREVAHANSRTG
jgi:molybdopterin synthase catalytic subunit